jgi:hypothetical protein
MEDMAKIYEVMGDEEKSTAWLVQAGFGASVLWGKGPQTMHIVDKLQCLLLRRGKFDEARLWRQFCGNTPEIHLIRTL